VHPTYYGIAGNLRKLVALAHNSQIPVLVDEAHGAHCYFHEQLPISAMAAQADMAATSLHKLGGSLIQSSVLNTKSSLIPKERLRSCLNMLTTTSTSYLLLCSLDTARRYLALHGRDMAEHSLHLARWAREKINQLPGLYCIGKEYLKRYYLHDLDETKLLIHLWGLKIHGQQAETWLRKHHRIEVELSDFHNLLCIITAGDTEQSVQRLITALEDLSKNFYHPKSLSKLQLLAPPEVPVLQLSPRQAFYSPTRLIPLKEAVGEVSAEAIMLYPPGIPIILPGEIISQSAYAYIQ
jgi:arginine/lysine/ornithine decarboxylase